MVSLASRETNWRPTVLAVSGLLLITTYSPCSAGRFEQFTKKAAQGRKLKPLAATYFGGPSHETFTAVGSQPDGTVVAFGNAWGPQFPQVEGAPVHVLGKGQRYPVNDFKGGVKSDRRGRPIGPSRDNPNIAGFIVHYAPDLRTVKRVTRFDWGVANISAALVADDGGLIVAGPALPHFKTWSARAKSVNTLPSGEDAKRYGQVEYETVTYDGDVFVARLSPDAGTIEWVWLLKGHRRHPKLFRGRDGAVFVDVHGLKRISADGRSCDAVELEGGRGSRVSLMAISHADGSIVRGGDSNSNTGREPWRRPLFFVNDSGGKMRTQVWDWHPHLVGHDDYRLVSDSAVKGAAFNADGSEVFVAGWSDGGNSVFTRSPIDLDRRIEHKGLGMSAWGAGVGSFAYLMRVDVSTFAVKGWTFWATYLRDQDKPNSARIELMQPLPGGAVAVAGGASNYLIQTPGAWYRESNEHTGGKGRYVAVFSPQFDELLFSSAIPAADVKALGVGQRGVLIACRSTGEQDDGQRSPTLNAVQGAYGGGLSDGLLILLERPQ